MSIKNKKIVKKRKLRLQKSIDTNDDDLYSDFNKEYFENLFEQEKMLADKERMNFYFNAINRYIKQGDKVIDLGTGTGVLSAFAERSGASVFAIDHSKRVLECAKKLAKSNQLNNIKFLNIHSSKLDLTEKVDVIIHEQMGDLLFDEDMISSVCDIRDRLLKPNGLILPSSFDFYCEPVKIIDSRHVPFIGDMNIHGFDLSILTQEHLLVEDPNYYHYRSSDPSLIDHLLCAEKPILSINLHSIQKDDLPFEISYNRKVIISSRCDALAVYFKCHLDELILSTSPVDKNRACHWGFRLLRTDLMNFNCGDTINIKLNIPNWLDLNSWDWTCNKLNDHIEKNDHQDTLKTVKKTDAVSFISLDELKNLRKKTTN